MGILCSVNWILKTCLWKLRYMIELTITSNLLSVGWVENCTGSIFCQLKRYQMKKWRGRFRTDCKTCCHWTCVHQKLRSQLKINQIKIHNGVVGQPAGHGPLGQGAGWQGAAVEVTRKALVPPDTNVSQPQTLRGSCRLPLSLSTRF